MTEVTKPFIETLSGVQSVPRKVPTSFGGECDVLAVDHAGNLLAVEVKPKNVA